jgi:hypothetical protein
MANHYDIIQRVREYADHAGTTPEAVCRAASNNPRLWPRLLARIDTVETDLGRLEAHMQKNPVDDCAERHDDIKRGNESNLLQGAVVEVSNND